MVLLRQMTKRRPGVPRVGWIALLVKRVLVEKVGSVVVVKVERRPEVKFARMVVVKVARVGITEANVMTAI